jgi:hypothetical protein
LKVSRSTAFVRHIKIKAGNDWTVAEARYWDCHEGAVEAAEANARLIAAAPDLLEACRIAQVYFEACGKAWAAQDGILIGNDGRPVTEAEGLDKLCDEAEEATRAAIARATGGAT